MKRSFIAVRLLVVVGSVAALAQAQAPGANPLVGTWKLNFAKSKFSADPPKSDVSQVKAVEGGLRVVHESINHQGQAYRSEYTMKFDGRDSPWKGTIAGNPITTQDRIATLKVDDYTYETVVRLKGQVLFTSRLVISRDGKTRTNTVFGKDGQGRAVKDTLFYEKQ